MDEEYRQRKEKAHKEHAEKLTELERTTLSVLTILFGNFIHDTLTAFEKWGAGQMGILQAVGEAFKSFVGDAINALKSLVVETLLASAKTILAEKAKAIASMIAKVIAAVPFPLNLVVIGGAIAAVKALFSTIKLGEGGVVMTPTPAVIGERGPEAVIPLNKLGTSGLVPTPAIYKQTNYFYGNITNAGSMDEISERLAEKTRRAIERGRK